jgi:hypothetical protein
MAHLPANTVPFARELLNEIFVPEHDQSATGRQSMVAELLETEFGALASHGARKSSSHAGASSGRRSSANSKRSGVTFSRAQSSTGFADKAVVDAALKLQYLQPKVLPLWLLHFCRNLYLR